MLLALACATALPPAFEARGQPIYSCPQPGAPPRYQDRPCAATPPPPPARATDAASLPATPPAAAAGRARTSGAATGAPAAAASPTARAKLGATPSERAPPREFAETRGEYVARNERRCTAGDRRACVAVECERSGGLGTKECQAALGYRRGPGWDLRPASDVFDPARRDDEYSLRCTQRGLRARVIVPRDGGDARVLAGTAEPATVPLDGIAGFASRYCVAR